jgi:hypothetical protein
VLAFLDGKDIIMGEHDGGHMTRTSYVEIGKYIKAKYKG